MTILPKSSDIFQRAGFLAHRPWDIDYLRETIPIYDISKETPNWRASMNNFFGRHRWSEWKASRSKKEDTAVLKKLSDILKDHFVDADKTIEDKDDTWVKSARKRRAKLKRDWKYSSESQRLGIERELQSIKNKLESNGYAT